MKNHPRLLIIILVIVLLTACVPVPTPAPTATAAPSATPTSIPTSTPVPPTPTPTLEPTPTSTPTEAPPVFDLDFSDSLTPESIEDVAGVVRAGKEYMQDDLAILHQKVLEALKAEGVTSDQLPYLQIGSVKSNGGTREFMPTDFGVEFEVIDVNDKRPVRAVLTKLDSNDGYVLTIPVDSNDGSGDIIMADFVIYPELLEKLEMQRVATGSDYELINMEFVKNELLPKLKAGLQPDFFGPGGQWEKEYSDYETMSVEVGPDTSGDEVRGQAAEGKVFFVWKCNIIH